MRKCSICGESIYLPIRHRQDANPSRDREKCHAMKYDIYISLSNSDQPCRRPLYLISLPLGVDLLRRRAKHPATLKNGRKGGGSEFRRRGRDRLVVALGDELQVDVKEVLAVPPQGLVGTKTPNYGIAQSTQHLDAIFRSANAGDHGIVVFLFLKACEDEANTAFGSHDVSLKREEVERVVDFEGPLVLSKRPRESCGSCGMDLDREDFLRRRWGSRAAACRRRGKRMRWRWGRRKVMYLIARSGG